MMCFLVTGMGRRMGMSAKSDLWRGSFVMFCLLPRRSELLL